MKGMFGTPAITTDGWHRDVTFTRVPVKIGMLWGEKIPAKGTGQTEFADMRASYDRG